MQPSDPRLLQRLLEDGAWKALDLDVHLKGSDAVRRAGDLEVHISVVVFLARDVGQDGEPGSLADQPHRDSRDRSLDRYAGVHESQRSAADRGHRRRAVRLQDVGHDADRVRERLLAREHGRESAACEVSVTDVAP